LIGLPFQALDRFLAFLARELAPSRRRFIEGARNAAKTTVTTGLAAAMQIAGPFGSLFAFRIGQPGTSIGLFEGALTIVCAAVMQAAIVPITGQLLDYPGLIMAFLFVVFALIAYFLSNTRLFLIFALVAVGTISTVYVAIFEPDLIGWGSAYTFDGILVATLVMVVFDTLIWPSPPEPRLLESLGADFERIRRRFEFIGQRYLDPFAAPISAPELTSMLARNLALLKPVKEQMKPTPRRLAVLLDAVMTAERTYLEVERLAVLADEPVSDQIRQNQRQQLETALQAVNKAFAERTGDILAGLNQVQDSAEWVSDLQTAIQRTRESGTQAVRAGDLFMPSELSNVIGFVGGLETIGNLLEARGQPLVSTTAESNGAEAEVAPRPFFDPAAFRFAVKLGAAITLGLLVGLTTQRADLQTILWSTIVAGQPNQYGAVLRKTLLRLTGCILGGLATLAAMILVSENFDSLFPYIVAIFAMTLFSTYVAQSSEWLGYAGIQAGITFLICYVGLGPASDVYKPLWRFWGIVLGVLTTGLVFLLLWPEYARNKLIERLDKLMRTTLGFAKDVAQGSITDGGIAVADQRINADLLDVLNMADQARFEGRHGATNSSAGIQAAATIVRIAYRFSLIARGRLSGSDALLPSSVQQRVAAFEETFCEAFDSELRQFELARPFEQPGLSPEPQLHLAEQLKPLVDDLALIATRDARSWPPNSQSVLAAQLESYRRLAILLGSLHAELSNFQLPETRSDVRQ